MVEGLQTVSRIRDSLGAGELGPEELGSGNHVGEGRLDLRVLTGLEPTVRVHPENVGLEHCKHFVDAVGNLLRGRDPRGVDVVHSWADSSTVLHSFTEH